MNILIVDDLEYDAIELTTKLATIYPLATITWRSSPDRALADVTCRDGKSYDVVFVDQHMPGSLGTDLVKRFGELLDRKLTRVILLTSDGGDTTRARALVSDCDGFLTKPVDITRLRAFLDGSGCQWEPSDLPSDMEYYWKMLKSRQNRFVSS